MPIKIVSTLDPPYEKSGSVTPTTGRMPVTMPRLKKACQKIRLPTPMARTAPKRSFAEEASRRDVNEAPQAEAAERADRDEDQKQDERRAEVGLLQDEQRRHAGEDARHDEIAQRALFALRIVVQVLRQRDDEKELHELA